MGCQSFANTFSDVEKQKMEITLKILVFGGTRFMGKHLVQELISKGHNVTIATRGITKEEFGDRITRLVVNRTDNDSLKKNIPDIEYDVVYDNLAYSSNDVKNLLDVIKCKRYIEISSASVYTNLHDNTKEEEFNAQDNKLIFCSRGDLSYAESKRQAESAIMQLYPHISSVMVRFPFVIGMDDYTNRLSFYVKHIINQIPIFINNINAEMSFVRSEEAGRFLAFMAENNFRGPINAANEATISIAEITEYIKFKTGKTPIITENGEEAPYNNMKDYSLNTNQAKSLGFTFTPIDGWIYDLIDSYIMSERIKL